MSPIEDHLRQKVDSNDPDQRAAAATELGRQGGVESLTALTTLLADGSVQVAYAAAAALAAKDEPNTVDALIPLLNSSKVGLRNLAVDVLSRMGPFAVGQVAALLDSDDGDVRKFAVDILHRIRTSEVEEPLIRALFDEDINVAAYAAEALGEVGTQRAVPHLILCLSKEPWLNAAALKSLGRIGGEEALNAILKTSEEAEDVILFCAVTALGTIGDTDALGYLITLLKSPRPAMIPAILKALERILSKSDESVIDKVKQQVPLDKITPLLESNNPAIVRSAIILSGLFRVENAMDSLARLYSEANEHLFGTLEEALLRIHPKRMEPFERILNDPMKSDTVKIVTVRLMGKLSHEMAARSLSPLLQTSHGKLKDEIIYAFARLKLIKTVPLLHAVLKSSDIEAKLSTIKALEVFKDSSSIGPLCALSSDPSLHLRTAAARSLMSYDLSAHHGMIYDLLDAKDSVLMTFGLEIIPATAVAAFKDRIISLCRHSDVQLRGVALEKTCWLSDNDGFAAAVTGLKDSDAKVRLAAIRGLERFPHSDPAAFLLRAAGHDEDVWNRYEAVGVLGRLKRDDLLPRFVEMLPLAPELVQTALLDTLGAMGGDEHRKIIESFIHSESEEVQNAAHEALKQMGVL